MVTLKGAIRTYGTISRRIERDNQRQLRENVKRFKEQQKRAEIEDATQAVKEYEAYISTIQSIHIDCSESTDWNSIKLEPKPIEPELKNTNEQAANEKLNSYTPSFFDKLFFQVNGKTKRLNQAIVIGRDKDKSDYENAIEELDNWNLLQEICKGIECKETKAYKQAIEYFSPFSDISELGSRLSVEFEKEYVAINLVVNSIDLVPNYILSQTQSGKLSKKNMPIGKFNEIYQDYVCSAALRLAREIHAYLPVKFAIINANGNLVNTSTGMVEEQTILSVAIPKETLNKLNFQALDPSDSMKNFVHKMKFAKANGFSIVEKIDINALKG